jgi:hypothetical protein
MLDTYPADLGGVNRNALALYRGVLSCAQAGTACADAA